ncbi:AAA family ATPase [Candidatus Poribacteria bacterium]|nr:AAA family ATPase [Candidatus Poribacteria bacterium]
MKDSTFITRVILKNYKSIAACDVKLQPLTFLVGRNGSGKSNFLDALRFVADALNTSLDHAIRVRGSIRDVCKRTDNPRDHHQYMSIHLEFALSNGTKGYYTFRIETRLSGFIVQTEECNFRNETISNSDIFFNVEKGNVIDSSAKVAPAAAKDRLYLANASGLPEFRPVYDAFSQMGFYNLNPDIIRNLQDPDFGNGLLPDGSNLTTVFDQLSSDTKTGIQEYLKVITPGIERVRVRKFGHKETFEFKQYVAEGRRPLTFLANNMSDGTLRALGILVALFQENSDREKSVTLVGIEEPEIALHPASVGVLLDAFQDATDKTQVIITSHSPDLLDNKDLDIESIIAVGTFDGNTVIGPVDDASRSVLRDKLFTTGELLQRDQLQPTQESVISDET